MKRRTFRATTFCGSGAHFAPNWYRPDAPADPEKVVPAGPPEDFVPSAARRTVAVHKEDQRAKEATAANRAAHEAALAPRRYKPPERD